tara:strand:+ start:4842 stop:5591 length:750 start_codon:yes stop_codon:yes gene_type:complete
MTSANLKKRYDTKSGQDLEKGLASDLRTCPIPDDEILKNLGLFLSPGALGRIMFIQFLYEKILKKQGVIAEFGCRYGQNLSLFMALRGIHEPYNRLRKIIGFDTFSGFVETDQKDNDNKKGDYSVPKSYEKYLIDILSKMEQFSPLSHLKKIEVVRGDVSHTVPNYIKDNPHTIFSLCYFDLDVYTPTKDVLRAIKPRIGKGTVLAFDELNDEDMPGETLAFLEEFDVNSISISRYGPSARTSYVVLGE